MEFQTTIQVEDQTIEDLLVTAMEGGSNYWVYLTLKVMNKIQELTPSIEGEPLALRLHKCLMSGTEFEVHDIEIGDLLGVISKESIKKALSIMYNDYNKHFNEIIDGDFDVQHADIFFQLAVMGEITFG